MKGEICCAFGTGRSATSTAFPGLGPDPARSWEELSYSELAFADDGYLLADTAEIASVMLAELREALRRASMGLQPRNCQWLALCSMIDIDALWVGAQAVPTVDQITVLATVISAQDPAGVATRQTLQQA